MASRSEQSSASLVPQHPLGPVHHPQVSSIPPLRSYIDPHIPPESDRYFIGDIYDRFRRLRDKTLAEDSYNDGQYLRYIKALSRNGWPNLLYLADFMESSTVPVKNNLLDPDDREERHARTDVNIVDYTKTTGLVTHRATSSAELSSLLRTGAWKDEPGSMRLIVVVDLSSSVIEALGSAFDVNPELFRGHINDYQWFHIRDPWFELTPLPSRSAEQSFFSVKYFRPFYLADQRVVGSIQTEVGGFNVLRRVQLDKSGSWLEPEGSCVGFLRSTVSFWSRPPQNSNGSLGILLLDPDVKQGVPLWGGIQNLSTPPGMNQPIPSQNGYQSYTQKLIDSISLMFGNDINNTMAKPINLVPIVLRSVAIYWQFVMDQAGARLSIIEWELQSPNRRQTMELDATLRKLQPWRRLIPVYRTHLDEAISVVENQTRLGFKAWEVVLTDFTQLEGRRKILERRVDKIMSVLTAIISIDENKKATKNAKDVTRVTYLAFVFIPLSFLASFFSMDSGFPNGGTTIYWVFFVVGIPLAGIPLLIVFYYESARTWVMERRA